MKAALLGGMEIGAVASALVFLLVGAPDAALANIAIAAYCRYARGPLER